MKDIAVAVIDLIFAIKDNNLDETKRLVSYLNDNYDLNNEEEYRLSENLVLDAFLQEDNECAFYVIDELNHLDYDDIVKFNRKVNKLILSKDVLQMSKFIDEQLSHKTYNIKNIDLLRGLSRMASINRNYEQLSRIRKKLQEEDEQ